MLSQDKCYQYLKLGSDNSNLHVCTVHCVNQLPTFGYLCNPWEETYISS